MVEKQLKLLNHGGKTGVMNMYNDIYSNAPYPLDVFLDKISSYVLLNLDEDYNILGFNEKFNEIVKVKKNKILNLKLQSVFGNQSLNTITFKNDESYKKFNLCFKDEIIKNQLYNSYICYIFNLESGYYLIGIEQKPEQGDIITKISKLNNEMANMTRELKKKNIKLKKANQKIEELLRTDELTGLSNRRHFMEYFEKMISNAKRHSFPLSLIMCDLDRFKNINDNYGHDLGDKVLENVGKILQKETRDEDLAARIGGEEFTIILNGTTLEDGYNYAERIRKKISEIEIKQLPKKVTISLGITELKESDDQESFLKRADKALYKAKNNGRNQVCRL
jgi:diguanylate cyclase (GGDEF)-like protein